MVACTEIDGWPFPGEWTSYFRSTAPLSVHDGKLFSLRIFPLMHFNWPHLSIDRAMQSLAADFVSLAVVESCYSQEPPARQTSSCLERYSHVLKPISVRVLLDLSNDSESSFRLWCLSRQARSYWLQTVPTVTWTPAMACYSKQYYKFDNISNYCQKSANINSS